MPREDLRELLGSLRRELDDSGGLDPAERSLLVDVHDEIEELLELSSETRIERRDSLVDRLTEAIDEFQASHPEFSRTIGNLADTLASMGF